MTGNQYFVLISVLILAYFIINIMKIWLRSKEAEAQIKMIEELTNQNVRIQKESIARIKAINEIAIRISKQGGQNE